MRTLVIVVLVVGPVLILGAPVVLTSGPTAPPWAALAAFAVAGAAALGGILLLVLSFRRPSVTSPPPVAALPLAAVPVDAVPAPRVPADTETPPVAPRRVGTRYIAAEPASATATTPRLVFCHPRAAEEPEPVTAPAAGSRSRYVTLRTRRRPARESVTAG